MDRLLDRQRTFREKLEWFEEAETLSPRLRKSRESQKEKTPAPVTRPTGQTERARVGKAGSLARRLGTAAATL